MASVDPGPPLPDLHMTCFLVCSKPMQGLRGHFALTTLFGVVFAALGRGVSGSFLLSFFLFSFGSSTVGLGSFFGFFSFGSSSVGLGSFFGFFFFGSSSSLLSSSPRSSSSFFPAEHLVQNRFHVCACCVA